MTVSPYASEAKISEALTAIGAELIGQTEQQLLQQIVVAAATASGGGGGGTSPVCVPLAADQNISSIRNAGYLFGSSANTAQAGIGAFNDTLFFHSNSTNDSSVFPMQLNVGELGLASSVNIGWSASNASSTKDLLLNRAAAATLQLGQNHASVATTQVVKAHNVTTGEGAALHLKGGTGSTSDGYVRVGTAAGGLGFFGAGGRTKPIGDNNQSMANPGGSSPSVHADSEFDGGAGGYSYTVGGIVKMLKELGILG